MSKQRRSFYLARRGYPGQEIFVARWLQGHAADQSRAGKRTRHQGGLKIAVVPTQNALLPSSRSMQAQWCRLLSPENALRLEVELNGLGPPSRLQATGKQVFREVCTNRLFKGGNGETR